MAASDVIRQIGVGEVI